MRNKNEINELEYEQDTGDYSVKKSNGIVAVIAFVICVIVSACIWAYALNVNDPIVEKTLEVNYEYYGFSEGDTFVPATNTIRVYGAKTVLEKYDRLEVDILRTDIKEDGTVNKKIKYPDGIKPVNKENKSVIVTVSPKNSK